MSIVDKMNEILDKQKERDNGGLIIPKIKEYVTKPGAPNPKVVDIFAAEKKIDLVTPAVFLDIGAREARLNSERKKENPSGGCPWFVLDDGSVIAETIAMCEYLDGFAYPSLLGETEEEKARTRMWQRRIEQQILLPLLDGYRWGLGSGFFLHKDMGMHSLGIKPAADGRLNTAKDQLRWLNQVMIENGSPKFICGDRFLLPDVQFAAFLTWAFERNYNKDDFIKGLSWVEDYYNRISTRPSVVESTEKNKKWAAVETRGSKYSSKL